MPPYPQLLCRVAFSHQQVARCPHWGAIHPERVITAGNRDPNDSRLDQGNPTAIKFLPSIPFYLFGIIGLAILLRVQSMQNTTRAGYFTTPHDHSAWPWNPLSGTEPHVMQSRVPTSSKLKSLSLAATSQHEAPFRLSFKLNQQIGHTRALRALRASTQRPHRDLPLPV